MYNIITAIGNEYINNELKKTDEYNIVFGDIIYQEAVFQVLQKNKIDKIILIDSLPGDLDKYMFIDEITKQFNDLDILIINSNNDKKYNNYLISKGIYKIINPEELSIEIIRDMLDKNEQKSSSFDKNNNQDKIENFNCNIKELDKKIIGISGTAGSGKTSFAINLANVIASTYNKKVLLIDLDTITASVDKLLNIPLINKNIITKIDDDKKCVLNYFSECIQKEIFDYEIFNQAIIQYPKNKNLSILTGNTSMFVCQNILNEKIYNKIMEKAKELFDYIVIDTSSNMFLDSTKWTLENAEIVYYIFEGTYKDINILRNSIVIFEKVWQIYSNKFRYILNKYTKNSLSQLLIQDILTNIEIECCIPYCTKNTYCLNNSIPMIYEDDIQKNTYENLIGIKRSNSIIEKVWQNFKGVF